MAKALRSIDPDVHFRVLHLLEEEPSLTQRELAEKLGISLGGVNYCLKSLIDIGHIKSGNFSKNPDKSVYLYKATHLPTMQSQILRTKYSTGKLSAPLNRCVRVRGNGNQVV